MALRNLHGQYTLVLGAGISARLVPQWDAFTMDVVDAVAARIGRLPESFPGVVWGPDGECVLESTHPLANEALLEHCWQELRRDLIAKSRKKKRGVRKIVELTAQSRREFADILRACLYRNHSMAPDPAAARSRNATLDALVETLLGPHAGRIAGVVTFNIDDWLERCLHAAATADGQEWQDTFFPISHPTWGPVRFAGARDATLRRPIYHLHGLLTSDHAVDEGVFDAPAPDKRRRAAIDAPNALVFTEEQYWSITATPSGFANHVMQSALQHSHCLFLGLSMRDRNLLRWLGMRTLEHERIWADRAALHFHEAPESVAQANVWRTSAFHQHVWVTWEPDPLVRAALSDRGVDTLEADFTDPAAVRAAFQALRLLD